MFSPYSTFAGHKAPTGAYRQVGVATAIEGAHPHKLVSLLFDALLDEITKARGAIARADVAEKGRAIRHGVRILEEGLLMPLDLERGGELAANLRDLYQYVVARMTYANLHGDSDALLECSKLLTTVREAWEGIAPQVRIAA